MPTWSSCSTSRARCNRQQAAAGEEGAADADRELPTRRPGCDGGLCWHGRARAALDLRRQPGFDPRRAPVHGAGPGPCDLPRSGDPAPRSLSRPAPSGTPRTPCYAPADPPMGPAGSDAEPPRRHPGGKHGTGRGRGPDLGDPGCAHTVALTNGRIPSAGRTRHGAECVVRMAWLNAPTGSDAPPPDRTVASPRADPQSSGFSARGLRGARDERTATKEQDGILSASCAVERLPHSRTRGERLRLLLPPRSAASDRPRPRHWLESRRKQGLRQRLAPATRSLCVRVAARGSGSASPGPL